MTETDDKGYYLQVDLACIHYFLFVPLPFASGELILGEK